MYEEESWCFLCTSQGCPTLAPNRAIQIITEREWGQTFSATISLNVFYKGTIKPSERVLVLWRLKDFRNNNNRGGWQDTVKSWALCKNTSHRSQSLLRIPREVVISSRWGKKMEPRGLTNLPKVRRYQVAKLGHCNHDPLLNFCFCADLLKFDISMAQRSPKENATSSFGRFPHGPCFK